MYSGVFTRSNQLFKGGYQSSPEDDTYTVTFKHTPAGTISNTGSGTDYMPPYINVYAWERVA
jgi:hypothetical protein